MKRELRILIVLVVLDLIGLGGLWFGYSTIAIKESKRTQLQSELADEKQKTSQSGSLQKTLKQAEKEHGELAKYFYDTREESQIRFVSEVEKLGTTTSGVLVEMKSFDLSGGGSPRFHSDIVLSGTWPEIYHFLRLIEVFPARVIINRFSANTKSVVDGTWSGSVSIDVVSLKKI
jgi:hypothetical protein